MSTHTTAVVVNDDPVQLELFTTLLHELGLQVKTFAGVEPALLFMAGSPPPGIIITDLYMPGIDGWRFCRLLKSPAYEELNEVPVIVVSATFSGEDSQKISRTLGAAGFLSAPVIPEVFIEQVVRVLRGAHVQVARSVLVVEDIPRSARELAQAFTHHGYDVTVAHTGTSASEFLKEKAFDYVLLDHHLPDMMGDRILRELKTRPTRQNGVCIMMTSDTDPKLALRWLQEGAWGFARKPIDPAYLVRLCEQAAREQALLRVEDHLEQRTLEVRRLLAEKELLLQEIHHRVKNNMHTVATLLQLQAEGSTHPQAKTALLEAQGTVRSVLSVYETLLGSNDKGLVTTARHLEQLLVHVLRSFAASERVTLELVVTVTELTSQVTVVLGIVLNELVTNSLKYGFPGERNGRIRVSVEPAPVTAMGVKVRYSDDGPGLPAQRLNPEHFGFGLSMVTNLCEESGGSLAIPGESCANDLDGFRCTLVIEAEQ